MRKLRVIGPTVLLSACALSCSEPADWNEALANAVANGNHEQVERALKHGASVEHTMPDGSTMIAVACLRPAANPDAAKIVHTLIVAGVDVNKPDNLSRIALTWAAIAGDEKIVNLLLAAHADPNLATNKGWTPLMAAANSGEIAVVKRLIAAGATVNTRDNQGRTAIRIAEENKNDEIADYLKSASGTTERE